jgi:hypothetical protein
MAAQPKQRLWGCLVATLGLLTAAAIRWHPERLHAPAWVAYCACAAFFFCGLALLADASGRRGLQSALAAGVVGSMLAVGAWAAFGPGERACSVSIPFLSTPGSDLACRGAFGAGSLVTAALLAWIVVRALRRGSSRPRCR